MKIVHDFFLHNGGGENLIKSISKELNLRIHTAVNKIDPYNKNIKISKISFLLSLSKIFVFIYYFFFFKLKTSDTILFSGNHCCYSIKRCNAKSKILYAHSLPKFLFNKLYLNHERSYYIPQFLERFLINSYTENINHLDTIIFNSEKTKQKFLISLPQIKDTHNLEVIYPFSDLKFSSFSDNNSGIQKYILLNSRHQVYKDIQKILLILYEYAEKKNDIKIIITQDGQLTKNLEKTFSNRKIIEFVGYLDSIDYQELISNSSAVIFPSDDEDFGISALDAYNANVPLLIKKNCGFLELLEKNYPLIYDDNNLTDILDLVLNDNSNNFYTIRHNFKKIFFEKITNLQI